VLRKVVGSRAGMPSGFFGENAHEAHDQRGIQARQTRATSDDEKPASGRRSSAEPSADQIRDAAGQPARVHRSVSADRMAFWSPPVIHQ
jgi:hypothetical protein